jgi:hypothetical protein
VQTELSLINKGFPPRFRAPQVPSTIPQIRLPLSNKELLIDHNGSGRASLQPLFRALLCTRPDFDTRGVNIVADLDDPLKIWGFVSGSALPENS